MPGADTVAALAAVYLGVGSLLTLLLTRDPETRDWPPLAWAWQVATWPARYGRALLAAGWSWRPLVALANLTRAARVAALTWLVRWGVRRLEAMGLAVSIDRPD